MIQQNKPRKAQISIEFLFALGIILLLFLVLFAFWFEKNIEVKKTGDYLEKKNECTRVASLLSSAFIGGDGTKIKISSIYYISIYNNSVGIRFLKDLERNQTRIAILASEAGESSQSFYDTASQELSPAWYKTCFSDIGSGSGCQQWQSNGMNVATWNSITKTIDNLMADLDNYNVIYLEDAHIRYNAVYNGKTYIQLLEDWVKKGNILIFAEHAMCREESSGTYADTSYRCNPPGYNSDIWDILEIKLHEYGGSYGNNITVVVEPDHTFFPNLHINDNFDFEEPSYAENVTNNDKTAYGGKLNGTYSDSGGSYSNAASNDNSYWYVGSNNNRYDITGYEELDYNINNLGINSLSDISRLDFTVTYCHDGSSTGAAACDGDSIEGNIQGTQDVELYNFSSSKWVDIGNLRTNDNGHEVTDTFSSIGKATNYINGSNATMVRYKIDYYNDNNEDSFLVIDQSQLKVLSSGTGDQEFVTIGKYNQNGKTGIASWDIGSGKAFYFADFQVITSQQERYSQIISDIIESANDLFLTPLGDEITCPFSSNVITLGEFSNKLLIENKKSEIFVGPDN